MMDKEKFSIIETFGQAPVHPNVFKTLDKKLIWLGICTDTPDNDFCYKCGTLTPKIPKSHHLECFYYLSADEYTYVEDENELGLCPKCNEGELDIDSSFSMQLSVIDCFDCGFHFEGKCDEETLIKRFKKKFKKVVN